jgi:hypothetical protein
VSDKPPTADKTGKPGKTSALLGDLESIRSLLAGNQDAGQQAPMDSDDEVPLLEDVVQGGVSVNEAFLAGEGEFADSGGASGLNDDVFDALLSNEWRDKSREAAAGVGAGEDVRARTTQSPAEVSDKAEVSDVAIMACIDETLQRWLRKAVLDGMDDLRRELLDAVRQQLNQSIAAEPTEKSPDEDPDGA